MRPHTEPRGNQGGHRWGATAARGLLGFAVWACGPTLGGLHGVYQTPARRSLALCQFFLS